MRRRLVLNPVTVSIALATVVLGSLGPSVSHAMPLDSQGMVTPDRQTLIEQAQQLLGQPGIQAGLRDAGVDPETAKQWVPALSDEQLARLVSSAGALGEGGSTGQEVIVIVLVVAFLAYMLFRYSVWTDWFQSDLKLRN